MFWPDQVGGAAIRQRIREPAHMGGGPALGCDDLSLGEDHDYHLTFAIRIEGDSMSGAGIFPGDIAVVDRARTPINGSIVLAVLDGSFTVKRYRNKSGAIWLQAENPAYPDLAVSEASAFEVWGVVTRSIRML